MIHLNQDPVCNVDAEENSMVEEDDGAPDWLTDPYVEELNNIIIRLTEERDLWHTEWAQISEVAKALKEERDELRSAFKQVTGLYTDRIIADEETLTNVQYDLEQERKRTNNE